MLSIYNSDDWRKLGNSFQFSRHKIFYIDAGSKDAPTILFLHGFPTSSYDFHRIVPALLPGFRIKSLSSNSAASSRRIKSLRRQN